MDRWLHRSNEILIGLYVFALATSMSGMEIFSTALFLHALVLLITKRLPKVTSIPFLKVMVGFCAVATLGVFFGAAPFREKLYDIGRLRFFLIYVVLFFELVYLEKKELWFRVLLGTTIIVGIYCFFQHFIPLDIAHREGNKIYMYAVPDQKLGPLVIGTFNHHLTFSNVFSFYVFIFLITGLSEVGKKKLLALHGIFLMVLVIWSQSRAALVAIPLSLLVYIFRRPRVRLSLLIFSAILVSLVASDKALRSRWHLTLLESNSFYQLAPRKQLWRLQWELFKSHPIFGVGWNNNERFCAEDMARMFPQVKDPFCGHAHSVPLQILATTGILGAFFFYWMWWQVFVFCLKLERDATSPRSRVLALALLVSFISFHLQGLTQWNFGDAEVTHNVIFFFALLASLAAPFLVHKEEPGV